MAIERFTARITGSHLIIRTDYDYTPDPAAVGASDG